MFPHLNGPPKCPPRVNIALLQEKASKDFFELIEKCEGTKAIVWDDSLSGPAGLIAKSTLLKQRNVVNNVPLRPGPLAKMDVKNIIFITRPELKLMDYIAQNVMSENSEDRKYHGIRKNYHLYFVPRRSKTCEKHLLSVLGSFRNIGEFRCDFFPVDYDLISMELKSAYQDLIIDEDPTCLYQAACGLVSLQKLYGRIPKIYGKGNFAEKVWEYARIMGREEKAMFNSDRGAIDQIIILDRTIDSMSILATQLTYEGLIDEIYGIINTTAHFPSENFSKPTDDTISSVSDKKYIILNSADELFSELRDKNFNEVGQTLSRHAKSISSKLDERHSDKSVQDMKKFVENLPVMLAKKQSVATHTTIAEMIKEFTDTNDFLDDLAAEQEFMSCMDIDKPSIYIEDLIGQKADFKRVIRLICIQCIAASGFKPKILDYYKRELVHVYGIKTLLTLSNLEKAGILKTQTETRHYAVLRKTLNLTVDEVIEISPKDISYVHSFYAPLTIRIVEQSLKPVGWQSLKSVLNILPSGQSFEDYQAPLIGIGGRRASFSSEISQSEIPRIILVFFVGGCTFAEISALRFLAQQEENNVEFVIATTKLINKNSFLDCFIENI